MRGRTLHLSRAAIDEQFDSRDVTAVVGGEKDNSLCNLIGRAQPSHRNDVGNAGQTLFAYITGAEEFVQGGSIDWARAYHVDPDTASFQIACPGARERADCCFGRRVNAVGRDAFDTDNGAVEDDGCAVGKERQGFLNREQKPFHVAVENAIKELFVDRLQ